MIISGKLCISPTSLNVEDPLHSKEANFEKLLRTEEGWPGLFRLHKNLLLLDGTGYEVPLIYDVEEKEYIEDKVLADFVKENFSDRSSSPGKSYDLFLFFGGDEWPFGRDDKGVGDTEKRLPEI